VAQIQKARAVAGNKAKKQQKKVDGIRPKYVSLTEESKRVQERIVTYQKDLKRAKAVRACPGTLVVCRLTFSPGPQRQEQHEEEIAEIEAELAQVTKLSKRFEADINRDTQEAEIQLEEDQVKTPCVHA